MGWYTSGLGLGASVCLSLSGTNAKGLSNAQTHTLSE